MTCRGGRAAGRQRSCDNTPMGGGRSLVPGPSVRADRQLSCPQGPLVCVNCFRPRDQPTRVWERWAGWVVLRSRWGVLRLEAAQMDRHRGNQAARGTVGRTRSTVHSPDQAAQQRPGTPLSTLRGADAEERPGQDCVACPPGGIDVKRPK